MLLTVLLFYRYNKNYIKIELVVQLNILPFKFQILYIHIKFFY